jgi:hypothetical protein
MIYRHTHTMSIRQSLTYAAHVSYNYIIRVIPCIECPAHVFSLIRTCTKFYAYVYDENIICVTYMRYVWHLFIFGRYTLPRM